MNITGPVSCGVALRLCLIKTTLAEARRPHQDEEESAPQGQDLQAEKTGDDSSEIRELLKLFPEWSASLQERGVRGADAQIQKGGQILVLTTSWKV